MAALSATEIGDRIPQGRYVEQTFQATTGAAAADEWIATGLSTIVAVVGAVVLGTGGQSSTLNFVKNAQGTGQSEDSSLGDLAIEAPAAATVEVTVRGKA